MPVHPEDADLRMGQQNTELPSTEQCQGLTVQLYGQNYFTRTPHSRRKPKHTNPPFLLRVKQPITLKGMEERPPLCKQVLRL